MSKSNILLMIPNLDFGGAQRSISKLSFELSKKYNVFFCVFNTDAGIAFEHAGQLVDLKVPAGKSFIGKIKFFFKRINNLKKFKKENHIKVSISFLEGADYVNILSKISSEKVIVSIRGSKKEDKDVVGFVGWIRKKILIPLLYRKADLIVTVSEGLKTEMRDAFYVRNVPIKTIYNFYDIALLVNKANEPISPELHTIFRNHKVIMNAGRFHQQKNFKALIDIFAQLLPAEPGVKLFLIGDGVLRNDLLMQAKDAGLKVFSIWNNDKLHDGYDIYFYGFDENPLKYISKISLFTFTSSWEGFPNALAEAMIAGVPVLSTDCSTGPREILAPGTTENYKLLTEEEAKYGVLMPVLTDDKDYKQKVTVWVKAVQHFLADDTYRENYAKLARRRMNDFSIENVMDAWYSII